MRVSLVKVVVLVGTAALTVSGCAYDYKQRSDRVGYHAGDAVRANIESQTINPSKDSMYNTEGLGKDGVVVEVEDPSASGI